jgi:hypothetical protein
MYLLHHALAIAALALLCAGWVLFQRWLKRADPGARGIEDAAGCSGNCQQRKSGQPGSAARARGQIAIKPPSR